MEIKKLYTEKCYLQYYVSGNLESKDTIVFLNGIFHGHTSWRKQYRNKILRKKFKLVFIDYRDCGESYINENEESIYSLDSVADDVVEILRAEKTGTCHLVGFSLGGQVAISVAARYQNEITTLVLLNTAIQAVPHSHQLISTVEKQLRNGVDAKGIFQMTYPWFFSGTYLNRLISFEEDIVENYVKYNHYKIRLQRFIRAFLQEKDFFPNYLREINIPTLLIGADSDLIFPLFCQKEIEEKLNQCQMEVLADCGHTSIIEKHALVNDYLYKFINKG